MSCFGMHLSFCNNINVQKVDDSFPEEFPNASRTLQGQVAFTVGFKLQATFLFPKHELYCIRLDELEENNNNDKNNTTHTHNKILLPIYLPPFSKLQFEEAVMWV